MKKKSINWNNILPHIGIILLFVIVTFMFLSPVSQGKELITHDSDSWKYMAHETLKFNENHEEKTLWTNSLFGGMPTYQVTMYSDNNILTKVQNVFRENMPEPVFLILLYLVAFYFFLIIIGCNKWMAVLGSVFMSFASYNIIIIAAGHFAKALVIAYMAPLIGSIWIAFRKDRLKGALLTLPFLALAIRNNHLQILYYTLFVLIILGIVEFIYSVKNKEIKDFFKTVGYLLVSAIIALGMNATLLLSTYEYSKYTMRGDSNGLTPIEGSSEKLGGLDKDYITAWSYGVDETLTLLIPDFKGGASGSTLPADSETGKKLKSMGVPNVERAMQDFRLPLYWGTQPFTSGPVYLGAIVCFLFVLGLCLVDARTKWWLVPVMLLTLFLSWGRNFMPLTDFFIDYIPLYNKFRTVSMTLVATGFCMSLLAILGLREYLKKDADPVRNIKALYISAGVTGGICLLFWLIPSLAGNFISPNDAQFTGTYEFLKSTLPIDRESLLRSDALRSLIFILLAAATLWIYNRYKSKVKVEFIYAALIILVAADLLPIDKRYLNEDNFEQKKTVRGKYEFLPSEADKMILQDKSYYRVLDASVNMFNDAKPSYFHKNIGGYHAAKLSRYQELITYRLSPEINSLFQQFNMARTERERDEIFKGMGVLNMLNMKYLIVNHQAPPVVNPYANGNAWFVSSYRIADNADQEMEMLGTIDTKTTLVVDKEFEPELTNIANRDTTATIELISYAPNRLKYSYNSQSEQLAVFSEVYYNKGWDAYINGEKVPYIRANYLLRAMTLKPGNYEIEFVFDPQIYRIGKILSVSFSVIFILLSIGYIVYVIKSRRKD
jgi:hypothetical protein